MTPETYSLLANAVDTAIEVFKVSLGGEFEEARKNLLKKETVSFVEDFFERMDNIGLTPDLIQSRKQSPEQSPTVSDSQK